MNFKYIVCLFILTLLSFFSCGNDFSISSNTTNKKEIVIQAILKTSSDRQAIQIVKTHPVKGDSIDYNYHNAVSGAEVYVNNVRFKERNPKDTTISSYTNYYSDSLTVTPNTFYKLLVIIEKDTIRGETLTPDTTTIQYSNKTFYWSAPEHAEYYQCRYEWNYEEYTDWDTELTSDTKISIDTTIPTLKWGDFNVILYAYDKNSSLYSKKTIYKSGLTGNAFGLFGSVTQMESQFYIPSPAD